jgi:hypothetical protein
LIATTSSSTPGKATATLTHINENRFPSGLGPVPALQKTLPKKMILPVLVLHL